MRPLFAACLATCLGATLPALARDPDLVSIGIGGTDILNQQRFSTEDFRLEYRSGASLVPYGEEYVKVKPWVGIEGTGRQSVFVGGGFWLDIPITKHIVLSPNIGVGYYSEGNGKYLGSGIEFRSTFEGGYVFDNQTRLVASFGHTSNAGITKHNPGTEAAVISYQMPISAIAGALTGH